MAKKAGFDIRELFGRGNGRPRGKLAVKYRDPSNPVNTWTGRGRMPRWMAAATRGGQAKKEDFLDRVGGGEGRGVSPAPIAPASVGPAGRRVG